IPIRSAIPPVTNVGDNPKRRAMGTASHPMMAKQNPGSEVKNPAVELLTSKDSATWLITGARDAIPARRFTATNATARIASPNPTRVFLATQSTHLLIKPIFFTHRRSAAEYPKIKSARGAVKKLHHKNSALIYATPPVL